VSTSSSEILEDVRISVRLRISALWIAMLFLFACWTATSSGRLAWPLGSRGLPSHAATNAVDNVFVAGSSL
jgi:hypothetical protein